MASPAPMTAAYKDALLALQAQQRARLSVLVQQTEAMLHSDWQRGMAAAASLYQPVLDEYAKALNALRIAEDDPAAKLSLDWLTSQNNTLKSIEQSVRASALAYGNASVRTVEDTQLKAMNAGLQDAEHLTQEALFPASELGVNPALLFNRPNPDAISQLVGRAGNGHPLGDLFANFPQEATSGARQALLMGLATGANPVSMAQGISQAMGISRSRAIVISRTEILGSYRSAAHETYRANSDVLGYWMWSAGGANPCAMCAGMDGTLHDLSEDLSDHPCGKCAPIPVTKPWSDILGPYGIDAEGLDETSIGAPGNYTSISEKFESYSPAKQREIIGTQTGYEAYKRGEVMLKDFIGVRPASDGFPSSYYQKSLKELQIPTRQAKRLVEFNPELAQKFALGKLRYSELGQPVPEALMPAWAKRSDASRIVYQILRNGLPYDMESHERGLLITNLAEMLKTDLPISERAAVERQLQALGGQVERLTLKGTQLTDLDTLAGARAEVRDAQRALRAAEDAVRADYSRNPQGLLSSALQNDQRVLSAQARLDAAQARVSALATGVERAYAPARATISDAEAAARAEVKTARSQLASLNRKLNTALAKGRETTTLERDIAQAKKVLEQAQAKLDVQVAVRKETEATAKAAAREAAKVAKAAERQAARDVKAARTGKPDVKPEAKFTRLVHANQKSDIASFADLHHMTVAEYEKAVTANLAERMDAGVISIREPQAQLEQILDAGRFKTVHEARTSLTSMGQRSAFAQETEEEFQAKVGMYADMRAQYEKEAFGYPLDLPVELRPVSGYIAPLTDDDPAARGWGDARIVLKDDVRSRSTFTVGDSLQNDHAIPEPVNAPKYDAFPFQSGKESGLEIQHWSDINDPLNPKAFSRGDPLSYLEAQIHGGVSSHDIAEVIFNSGANPSEALIAKLNEAGIPWRLESGGANVSREAAAEAARIRFMAETRAKYDLYHAALDQSDPAVKQYLKDLSALEKARAKDVATLNEKSRLARLVTDLEERGKQATVEYRDAKVSYEAATVARNKTYKAVNKAMANLRVRSPDIYKPELDSVAGFKTTAAEMGIRITPTEDEIQTAEQLVRGNAAFAVSRATVGSDFAEASYDLTPADRQFVADLKQQVESLDQQALAHGDVARIGQQLHDYLQRDAALNDYHDYAVEARAIRAKGAANVTDAERAWAMGKPDAVAAHGGVRYFDAEARYQAEFQARALAHLQEMRPMGGADLALDTTARGFNDDLAQTLQQAQEMVPRDWIAASNDLGTLNVVLNRNASGAGWFEGYANGAGKIGLDLPANLRQARQAQSLGLHEIMHRMEQAIPQISQLEEQFYNARTLGDELVDLTNGVNAKTKLDNWIDPYIGRAPLIIRRPEYDSPLGFPRRSVESYEILSVGAEAILGGGATYDTIALREDEGFINFILGLLATIRAEAPGALPGALP